MFARFGTALLLAVATVLGGCAIYSEARDKQGQAAHAAWVRAKAALDAPVATARKNVQGLLDEQLATEESLWKFRRSQLAQALAFQSTLGDFKVLVVNAQMRVGKGANEALKKSIRDIERAHQSISSAQASLAIFGLTVPDCGKLTDEAKKESFEKDEVQALGDGNAKDAMTGLEPSLVIACTTLKSEPGKLVASGELQAAQAALDVEQAALASDKKASESAQSSYTAALAQYNASAEALLRDPTSSRDNVTQALEKLAKLEGDLTKVQDAFSAKFVAQARLDSLDRFLSTYKDIASGKAAPADANRTAIALAVFSDLRDKATKSLNDLEKPNLVPLVTQKTIEQAKISAAQRDIDTRQQLIAQRQAYVDAVAAQVDAYQRIADVTNLPEVAALGDKTALHDALKPADATDRAFETKVKLWRAVARFLDAEGRLRADAGKAEYRILALNHERALTYAEANIAQWQALIDPSVQVLADYAAAGLKASDVTAFLNSLTLLWIGAGVHK